MALTPGAVAGWCASPPRDASNPVPTFQPPYQPTPNGTTDHHANPPTNLYQPPCHTPPYNPPSPITPQGWKRRKLAAFQRGYAGAALALKRYASINPTVSNEILRRKSSTTGAHQFPAQHRQTEIAVGCTTLSAIERKGCNGKPDRQQIIVMPPCVAA